MNKEIVIVEAYDWQGLYINGKLVAEAHVITIEDIIPYLGNIEIKEATDSYDVNQLVERGCFHKNLSDVELK